jgi:hypothetical protein
MKKILFILGIAFIGCEEKEPTCMVCFVDGVEVYSACVEDFPQAEDIYHIHEAIDPLLDNEECSFY